MKKKIGDSLIILLYFRNFFINLANEHSKFVRLPFFNGSSLSYELVIVAFHCHFLLTPIKWDFADYSNGNSNGKEALFVSESL